MVLLVIIFCLLSSELDLKVPFEVFYKYQNFLFCFVGGLTFSTDKIGIALLVPAIAAVILQPIIFGRVRKQAFSKSNF